MLTLAVGLGNPGDEYKNTRHNIGFLVLDALAKSHSLDFQKKKPFEGWVVSVALSSEDTVLLLKPATYVNVSGRSVLKVLSFYHITPENLIVIADDLDLPFGTLRTRLQGSPGGHNGLRSIQETLGTNVYRRVRLGVGNSELKEVRARGTVPDFVLSPFDKQETEKLDVYCQFGVEALLSMIKEPKAETRILSQ